MKFVKIKLRDYDNSGKVKSLVQNNFFLFIEL